MKQSQILARSEDKMMCSNTHRVSCPYILSQYALHIVQYTGKQDIVIREAVKPPRKNENHTHEDRYDGPADTSLWS